MAELSVATADRSEPRHEVSLNEAFRVWLKVALLSFGGPTAQIAVMHRILVDEERAVKATSGANSAASGVFSPMRSTGFIAVSIAILPLILIPVLLAQEAISPYCW